MNFVVNSFFLLLDTYKLVLLLEVEKQIVATSESESRIGKRKVKNNKYNDYVNYTNPPRLLSSKESYKSVLKIISFLSLVRAKYFYFQKYYKLFASRYMLVQV